MLSELAAAYFKSKAFYGTPGSNEFHVGAVVEEQLQVFCIQPELPKNFADLVGDGAGR
jgi:hypothetical protein